MARTAYAADLEIQHRLFGEYEDMDLYSAYQVTYLLELDFVGYADDDAEFYLA
jgi:hypothetical protein